MSTELAIETKRGQSLAEITGETSSSTTVVKTPSIARLGMLHQPIMGEVELKGKMIKTEVVPVGAFTLKTGDDIVYSNGATIRIFLQRNQWQRWNSETEEMEKSVMAKSLNGDLKDSIGGFNLGRPSGYIEDFNALDEATKQLMRSVKRVMVYYGLVTLDNPMNDKGEPLDKTDPIPFVMDVKNRDSLKSINGVLSQLKNKDIRYAMNTIRLEGVEDSIPTGAKFGKISASVGDFTPFSEEDEVLIENFQELESYNNGKILDLFHERSKSNDAEDAKLVNEILDNSFVDV